MTTYLKHIKNAEIDLLAMIFGDVSTMGGNIARHNFVSFVRGGSTKSVRVVSLKKDWCTHDGVKIDTCAGG